ncbi:MAG: DsrE family protein [Herbaspirillum sp.]
MKKFILMLFLGLGLCGSALADNALVSEGVVVQANGKDAADFKRALILASNMHHEMPQTKFELIVFGPSVKLLTAFSDAVPLIQKIQSEGIQIIACGRSLNTENLKDTDLTSNIKVEPFGAVWLVNRQKQGWQYIKP